MGNRWQKHCLFKSLGKMNTMKEQFLLGQLEEASESLSESRSCTSLPGTLDFECSSPVVHIAAASSRRVTINQDDLALKHTEEMQMSRKAPRSGGKYHLKCQAAKHRIIYGSDWHEWHNGILLVRILALQVMTLISLMHNKARLRRSRVTMLLWRHLLMWTRTN